MVRTWVLSIRKKTDMIVAMIPKLIHQTAKTAEIPPKWQKFQWRLKELHPDWTYRLWTDADNLAFVTAEYPDFLPVFQGLPRNIMRADVIRYLLMHRLGGMYMDLDYEMLKPFDLLDHEIVLPWESSGEKGVGNDLICNSFFASVPGHPFWKMAIDDLATHPPTGQRPVVEETGPDFLTKIMKQAERAGVAMYRPEREWFNPVTPRGPREYRRIVQRKVSYGIHHCSGSWRQISMAMRLRMRLQAIIYGIFR